MSSFSRSPHLVLPILVIAQLLGTSPWFAVNAVMPDLQVLYGWSAQTVSTLTVSLTLGFILGTLAFALLGIADRFKARYVFFICATCASLCCLLIVLFAGQFNLLLGLRFATGFFLAGIYPVGMKIAAAWFPKGLGAALGWLIGALVLGSAAPHGLRAAGVGWDWQAVLTVIALFAFLSGLLVLFAISEAPQEVTASGYKPKLELSVLGTLWTNRKLRSSVFGYFGHMWELYTFWVLVPTILALRLSSQTAISWSAFFVLGAGVFGCVGGGLLVKYVGGSRVAAAQLFVSGVCCLLSPIMLNAPLVLFGIWLLIWGVTVSGDSPQFSALTANNAPKQAVGSILTLTNSIGFAVSAVSIEVFVGLSKSIPLATLLPWLAIGPVLGLLALYPLLRSPSN